MRPGNAEPDATCPWCGLQAHPFQLVQHTWTHTIPVKRRAGDAWDWAGLAMMAAASFALIIYALMVVVA